jgi:hypothetical protein
VITVACCTIPPFHYFTTRDSTIPLLNYSSSHHPTYLMRHFVCLLIAVLTLVSLSYSQVVVPQWAKDAIWYQIFPERFRNGDQNNDPTSADLELTASRGWKVSP